MFTKDFWNAMNKVAQSKIEESSSIVPYRSPGLMPEYPKPAKKKDPKDCYGLMRIIKEKEHECKTPGSFRLVFMFLTLRPIHVGSLYRCSCGSVYSYLGSTVWTVANLSEWVRKYKE